MAEAQQRLRVAHISDCYAPRTGGIETQVGALVRQQARAGLDVLVITATPDRRSLDRKATVSGHAPSVHRVVARMPWDLPIHPRTRHHVQQVLTREQVDLVHVHLGAVSPFAWGGIRAAHRLGLPILVTVHSMWGPVARLGYRLSQVLWRWDRWRLRLAAVSPVAAQQIERAVPACAPVLVLPNGIDVEDWRQSADATGDAVPNDGQLRLVSVLRLAPRKRVGPLLRIVEQAGAGSGLPMSLTIIGDGPQRTRVERLARRLRHARVRVAGRLDAAGIRQEFARADLFVQPSVRESFGLAALEARTWGLPVLARSQSGSGAFVVDGVTGFLVATDEGMVSRIAELAGNPALMSNLAASTRTTPVEQTWPRILDTTTQAYRDLLAARP
ncbi:MAG: glycosyltransferase family 4 protein [Actinomycetales bacterium]